jgi:hypothetical protein
MVTRETITLWAILALALIPGQLYGANHYIRAGASGDGSDWENALPLLPERQVRGDIYYIADGEYGLMLLNCPEKGTEKLIIRKATITEHGTDTGWKDEYGVGYAKFSSAKEGLVVQHGYTEVDGATGGGPGSWDTGHGFWFHGCENWVIYIRKKPVDARMHHLVISHAKITTAANVDQIHGTYINQTHVTGLKYEYLYFQDIWGNPFQGVGHEGTITQYCMVDGMKRYCGPSYCAHMEAYRIGTTSEYKPYNHIIRYNIWKDCTGTGLFVLHGEGFDVYGNIFMWSKDFGSTFMNGTFATIQEGRVRKVRMYNNIFVDIRANFCRNASDFIARNNIFVNCWRDHRYPEQKEVGWSSGVTHSHNFYYKAGTETETGAQIAAEHPFVKYAPFGGMNNDLRLKAPTAAGFDLGSEYNLDIEGRVRGKDGNWDMGAYEYDPTQPTSVQIPNPIYQIPENGYLGGIPNPLNISILTGILKTGVQLYNITGQQLNTTHGVRPGVYFIELNGNQQPVIIK